MSALRVAHSGIESVYRKLAKRTGSSLPRQSIRLRVIQIPMCNLVCGGLQVNCFAILRLLGNAATPLGLNSLKWKAKTPSQLPIFAWL